MRRRIVWTTVALAVLLLVPSFPASAAEFTLQKPDGDVTGATPIQVKFERDFNAERFRRVRASLQKDGSRLGTPVDLECRRACEDLATEPTIYVLPGGEHFDPATGAPFDATGPLANGAYTLKVELLKDSNFQDDQTFEGRMHLAVPPSAPSGLAAEVDGGEVSLTWNKAPEPDIRHYRVERRDGDGWKQLTTTSSGAFVDEPGEGTHTYRVVAERPDGRDGFLETASAEKRAEVVPSDDGDEPGEGGGDGADGDGDGDSGDGDGRGDGRGDGGTDEGDQEEADADQSDTWSQNDSSRPSHSSSAAAPSIGSNRQGSIPGIGERDSDGYATELDYGALGDGEAADDVRVANPGGWRGTVDRIFDAERVAVPIAAGLVMTGMGLHLWRWLRVPLP